MLLNVFFFFYRPLSLSVCYHKIQSYDSIIKSSNLQKLLGVTIDSNFTFEQHINSLCRKSSQKLHALSRIAQYLSPNKKRILFKKFVTSQFNYCPLVWMCHSRYLNNRINNIHLRALRIVY